ncbi:ComF family protein [Cryomorpha ignava]|uniref:ComF family protein n=1 Tax=Cryomorpha ignava TaxID=101383 RepID=A0A7K3WK73_9FLAO|nr:phosphoribosyltransferase family protein [Cryomorpha ignava]NEN22050.1 ComF family protein [Cryomorpha ignava]
MANSWQKYYFGWLSAIETLLFPINCAACGNSLNNQEDTVCIACLYKLPRTNFHRVKDNPVAQKFDGRMPINAGFSFLFFHKGNLAQILLHQLKYKDREDLGERLGAMFAKDLKADNYDLPDLLIPLPLHPAKLALRGYNQCHSIALGMTKHLDIEVGYNTVARVVANPTQTRKARFDRWLNVAHIFEVAEPEKVLGRHILLLDDVITTGSTLEACGRCLLEAGAREISIATIASA